MSWHIEKISKNVCKITVELTRNSDWEQWVLLRSDVHHDNPKCDQALEKKHLDEALEYNAPVVDNGDLMCAMQGRWDKRADKNSLREEHRGNNYFDLLVDTAAEFYRPYKDIFAVLGKGNHETAISAKHETDLTDRLAAKMRSYGSRVEASGYGGWVIFQFREMKAPPEKQIKDSVRLYHYHGSGGGGIVSRGTLQPSRIGLFTVHPGFVWVVVQSLGKGTPRNARQRTLPASAWPNRTLERLRGQTRHAIPRDPRACRAPARYQVLLP